MANTLLYLFSISWPVLSLFVIFDPGAGLPAVDFLRIIAALFLLIVFFKSIDRKTKFRFGSITIPCILFVIFFLLCLLSRDFVGGIKLAVAGILDLYFVPLSVYLFIINCHKPNYKILFRCLLFSGAYIAVIGIAEFSAGRNLIGPLSLFEQTIDWKHIYKVYRVNGPFGDIIGYGSVVLLHIPFIFYALNKKIISPMTSWITILVISAGSIVTLSKANGIALLVVFLILSFDMKFKRFFIIGFSCITAGILLYISFDFFRNTSVYQERIAGMATVIGRWEQYRLVLKLFAEQPLLGIGYGQYFEHYDIQIHNSFLKQLVELGLVGFIPYSIFVFSLLFSNIRKMIFSFLSPESKTRWAFAFISLFIGSTIDLLWNKHFMLALMMMIGFMQLHEREATKAPGER